MYNPAYLTLSRHHIYYFRWPLPAHIREQGKTAYLKISLRTRNPKEALPLANAMAYHAHHMTNNKASKPMSYIEIKSLLESFFSSLLAEKKLELDTNGPLLPARLHSHRKSITALESDITDETKDINAADVIWTVHDKDGTPTGESYNFGPSYSDALHVLNTLKLPIPDDAAELDRIQKLFRRTMIAYHHAIIDHNTQLSQFTFDPAAAPPQWATDGNLHIPQTSPSLQTVIDKYVYEMDLANTWGIRAKEERLSCFAYLTELLGARFPFANIDAAKARYIKETLSRTPTNRGKLTATRGLSLLQQIEIEGLETLSVGSINKYLQCYSSLFDWAVKHDDTQKNPFKGIAIKEGGKNKKKRDWFKPEQSRAILTEINKGKAGLANTDMKYWGVLIGLYTGARLNEIASLTPNDIKQDQETGIWYFDINDEDEKKHLKTDAATRKIPIHSELIQRGFIQYVEQIKKESTADTRILPNLTYSEKEGWGRKLTRWFSNVFLPNLNLKTDKLSFHSLRHTAITTMRNAEVDNHTIRTLVGHEPDGVTEEVYVHGYNLKQLQKSIEKIVFSAP